MWYSGSFTPPDGSVYGDRRVAVQDDKRQASFMVTRNVILSKECHSERSEESGEEGRDNGPRTSQIRILLKDKLLQKSVVRGEGTEKVPRRGQRNYPGNVHQFGYFPDFS